MPTNLYDISIWEEVRSIVSWKTDQLVESINKEISEDRSLAEFQGKNPVPIQLRQIMEQRANAWIQRLYDLCCDAYASRGKILSADFDRAVWFYRIAPFIMGQTDSQIHTQTMGGFLNLLLCAVGSPLERRSSLTVSQKEHCFDVRMKVYETWHDKLHHLPPRINEAVAVLAQAAARERCAARIAAGLPPDDPPPHPAAAERTFRWEDLDHQLIDLKLASLAEQMQVAIAEDERLLQAESAKKGNSAYFLPAFFEKQEERTREWARKVYGTYCEVWQLQRGTMTLNFVKAIYEKAVVPLIAARQGGAEGQVMLRAARMGSTHSPQLPAAVGQWHRQIQNLRVSLWREFEIETSEWKYTLAAQQAEASKPPENVENRGLPPDGSQKKTVPLTKAPPPPPEVGGRGVIHEPKPTEIPRDLPVDYPRTLVARTFVVIGEAVKTFPIQTQTLELCRYVISELTPHFREALQNKVFRQDQALSRMHDLVHYLLVHNCGDGRRSEIEKEVLKSDEWLMLAREIAKEIDNDAPVKAASIESAGVARESLVFTVPSRLREDQAGETNELSLTVCAVCGHYEAHHDQAGCFLDPHGRSSQDPGILSRPDLKKTGALCWCPKFLADFSQAADLIYESGNSAALKHGAAEAITRGDSRNARRLLDRLIIETPPVTRDLDWIKAVERSIAAIEPAVLSSGTVGSTKPGRALARSPDFVNLVGRLWLNALGHSGNVSVTTEHLKQIASRLDEGQYVPPAEYLEDSCARELKAFNSKNSHSKIGPIQTWSGLVTFGDKDHLRGMRRLLSRCAQKQPL